MQYTSDFTVLIERAGVAGSPNTSETQSPYRTCIEGGVLTMEFNAADGKLASVISYAMSGLLKVKLIKKAQ